MNLRDALDVKVGSTPVNKIYKGTYKVWDRNKIALEGYCIQNGTPSPDNEVPIEVMQGRQVVTVKGTDYTVDLKSKNELNYDLEPENKYYDMNGQPVTISGAVYVNQTINLLANTTYTFSYEEKIGDAIARLCEYKEDGTFIKRTLIQNNNVSIKLNSETSYVITSTNKAPTTMFIKPQLEEGSEATPYEPYYDYKLAGIGDYKDNFYTDKGKWYLEKKFENKTIDNNTTIYRTKTDTNTIHYNISNSQGGLSVDVINCISNKLKNYTANQLWSNDNEGIAQSNTQIVLRISKKRATSVAELTEWLQSNNINGWFILGTPTVEEITAPTLINQLNALYQAM